MRLRSSIVLVVVLLTGALFLAACDSPAEPTEPAAGTAYEPQYATGFGIEYLADGAKILVDAGGQRILLLPEGVAAPADATYDVVINGPVERAVALSTTQAGHFVQLNSLASLAGVAREAEKWHIPAVREAMEAGEIANVGKDDEAVVALDPQIVFFGASPRDAKRAAGLREAGLTCVQFDDAKEAHYLGRAEWLVFLGAFLDQEEQAKGHLAAVEERVVAVTDQVQDVTSRPKVLWFYYSSSGVNWNVYTEADYVSTLVDASGGTLLTPNPGEGAVNQATAMKIQDENFLGLLQEADIIIFGRSLVSYPQAQDLTYFNNSAIDFATAPAYQAEACYVVGSDWFQASADVAPVIETLAAIMQPDLFPDTPLSKLAAFFPPE